MKLYSWFTWSIWIIAFVVQASALSFAWLVTSDSSTESRSLFLRVWSYVPGLIAFSTVGAIIVSRRRGNSIGWILLGIGFIPALGLAADAYIRYVLVVQPGSLPFNVPFLWISPTAFLCAFLLMGLMLLLFPNGRLLSWRWHLVARLLLGLSAVMLTFLLLKPGPIQQKYPSFNNSFGIEGAAEILDGVISLAGLMMLLLITLCAVAVLLRFRSAQGEERIQIKWFAYAAFVLAIDAGLMIVLGDLLPKWMGYLAFGLVLVAMPISIGIAILRYRLFDIDVIIRRTLIYGALTAMLLLVYFGSVILLQQLFRSLTGAGDDLAIIVSTLALAALFNPLRRRVQDAIDRAFFRRKYDAARVLAQFAATARDEVELEKLTARLVEVVQETMQPKSVSVWLKKTGKGR